MGLPAAHHRLYISVADSLRRLEDLKDSDVTRLHRPQKAQLAGVEQRLHQEAVRGAEQQGESSHPDALWQGARVTEVNDGGQSVRGCVLDGADVTSLTEPARQSYGEAIQW